ncbi:MAG: VCBS repeat-containing protein [Ignavibacteria bacterium]|nr:VCBS repeat-containing protein [Ignavibacteria bacterium]
MESWIEDRGMGLSATVSDINLDGLPDIYVANDFNSSDLIYLNNGDGTFAESMSRMTRRASVFSMGSDVADLNGDGLPDIITTDMLPDNHFRRILNAGNNGDMSIHNPTYDSNQVSRNMVQLNRGYNQFSDIGYMTGMAATDWSWACLINDFDLDGLADVFIGNGYTSDLSNQDYIYNLNMRQQGIIPKMGFLTEPNCMFRQQGDLDFKNVGVEWGVADTSTTFGAAYGDLDGDGDLDLVVANMDTVAFVYRNNAVEQQRGGFVCLTFKGSNGNTGGLGAKVRVVAAEDRTTESTTSCVWVSVAHG